VSLPQFSVTVQADVAVTRKGRRLGNLTQTGHGLPGESQLVFFEQEDYIHVHMFIWLKCAAALTRSHAHHLKL
jgi:hypothetical protein